MSNDKDSAVLATALNATAAACADHVKTIMQLRAELAALRQPTQSEDKCIECSGKGYAEIIGGCERPCDVCYGEGFLRQPTQSDALCDALEAAPLIGATESAESFKARQDAWLNGQYRAALQEQSK